MTSIEEKMTKNWFRWFRYKKRSLETSLTRRVDCYMVFNPIKNGKGIPERTFLEN